MKVKSVLSLICVVGFIGWCLWSCESPHSYSEIPEIHFKSLSFEYITTELGPDLKAVLTFSFVDGDGDIGVRTRYDTVSKIHYKWYKKYPDMTYEMYQFPDTTIISSEIPYDEVMNKDEAHNKTLKGTIEIALTAPTKIQDIDTMRIEFFIFDRARNKSNVEYTHDFSILNPPSEPITK